MLEKAFVGSKRYWAWLIALVALIAVGFVHWLIQFQFGLKITGVGRDVLWGLYIGNFTYLVGIAAGGMIVVCIPLVIPRVRANENLLGAYTTCNQRARMGLCGPISSAQLS